MEKIDRLGWADGFAFRALGVKVGVRATRADVLEELRGPLPPDSAPLATPEVDLLYSLVVGGPGSRPGVKRMHVLYADETRQARAEHLPDILRVFEMDLSLKLGAMARGRLVLHAGVVEHGGRALVLPGHSMSGKSTLVTALVKAGATLYSDEYAVIDAHGRVHPYRRPISLREGPDLRPVPYRPEAFGGRWGRRPVPVGLVALTAYRAGARFTLRPLTAGRATVEVFAHALAGVFRPERTFARLAPQVAGWRVEMGVRGEADDAARRLLERLAG